MCYRRSIDRGMCLFLISETFSVGTLLIKPLKKKVLMQILKKEEIAVKGCLGGSVIG